MPILLTTKNIVVPGREHLPPLIATAPGSSTDTGIVVLGQRGYAEHTDAETLTIIVTEDTVQGNTLFLCVKLSSGAHVDTVTTTAGDNTWNLSVQSAGSLSQSAICCTTLSTPLSAGAKVVIHANKSQNMAGQLFEVTGLAGTPLTATTLATNTAGGGSTISVTGTSTVAAPQLAVTAVGNGTVGPATWGVSAGWTKLTPAVVPIPTPTTPTTGPPYAIEFLNLAYRVLADPHPVTVTWTDDTGTNLSVAIATYKGTGA